MTFVWMTNKPTGQVNNFRSQMTQRRLEFYATKAKPLNFVQVTNKPIRQAQKLSNYGMMTINDTGRPSVITVFFRMGHHCLLGASSASTAAICACARAGSGDG